MIELRSDPGKASRSGDISFLLFAAGGVIGLFNAAATTIPFGQGFEMVALANNLAHHGAYANPFQVLDTGPTAANPPLYPFLLAIIIRIFRIPVFISLVATLGNILANACTAAWLPRVSLLFYRDERPGIIASALWLLSAPLMPSWDTGYTVATLLLFCLFTSSRIDREHPALTGACAGLLAAALFLFNPSTILIFLPWTAWLAFDRRGASTRVLRHCCALLAVLVLISSAWGLRNQGQLGEFVIRTNLGMTLYASNNDCARSSLIAEELNNCYQLHHPNTSLSEARLLLNLGEPAYDRMRVRDARAWIQAHPAAFFRLTIDRIRDFWFPPAAEHPFYAAVISIATVLSIPGLLLVAYRRERLTAFTVVVLLLYPLMYYTVVSDVRYRLPVLWLSLLPAGYLLWGAIRSLVHRNPWQY